MVQLINDFIQMFVFVEEEDEEMDDHTKIEELHKRRNYLAGLCKLVVYNVVPMKTAADIFKHYVTFYNDYGKLIQSGFKYWYLDLHPHNKIFVAK
jgi:cohesin complex subunit SA-1/2